jgi:hypothetical protein
VIIISQAKVCFVFIITKINENHDNSNEKN